MSNEIIDTKRHKGEDLYLLGEEKPLSLGSKALVLSEESEVVVATYREVFDYKELNSAKELKNSTHMEKTDGHLVAISGHKDGLLFVTESGFNGRINHMAKMWYDKNLTPLQKRKLKSLAKKNTLLFDYVSPDECVVIKYPKEDLILHGIINNKNGEEIFDQKVFDKIAEDIGVNTVARFDVSLESLKRVLKQSTENNLLRGFVTRLEDGRRVSLETEEYKKSRLL